MKLVRYLIAKILIPKKINPAITKVTAERYNHLNAIIRTKGSVKLDWYKLRGIEVVKCHRCLAFLHRGPKVKGEFCDKCKEAGYQ
jgi:hypothetical protein